MAVTSAQVQELYVGLLGRAADKAGLDYWLGQLNATGSKLTLENLRANFVNQQAEYAATYGNLARADLVKAIYTNLFERTPTTEEVNYWANGSVSADQMVVAFLNGASAADKQVVGNKVFVAESYTSSTGASYNAAAAKAIVDNVNGTTASVNAALTTLESGGLAGQVPALGLVNKLAVANAAVASYEKAVATSNPAFDTNKDGAVTSLETAGVYNAAKGVRDSAVTGSTKTTGVLTAELADANAELATAKAAAVSANASAVANYDAAVANLASLKGTAADQTAHAAAVASAKAGIAAALTASTIAPKALDGTTALTTADGVYTALTTAPTSPAEVTARAALVTELQKAASYGTQIVALAEKTNAIATAEKAVDTTVPGSAAATLDGVAVVGPKYIAEVGEQKVAAELLAKIQALDVKVAEAKVAVDQFAVLNKAVVDAGKALVDFEAANTAKVDLHDITTGVTATAKSDVFYFADKMVATDDFTIGAVGGGVGNFGAGDHIVLGSSIAYNSGALTAGNGNTQEFFLVQTAAGVQVVIETANYGSSTTVVGAGNVIGASDNAAVITLVGVTAQQLSVHDGVISYVA